MLKDFRATLSDSAGKSFGIVEGVFTAGADGHGALAGEFDLPDCGDLLQAALEGTAFALDTSDKGPIAIRIDGVESAGTEGMSRVRFTAL